MVRGPVEILIVDDSETDVELLREAIDGWEIATDVHVARDGVEAMDYLNRNGQSLPPVPQLVLLDLNMPRMNGREVLRRMRESDALRGIPVVVLTSSRNADEVAEVYRLHANSFVTKPIDFAGFESTLEGIRQFWFEVAELPRPEANAAH